MGQFTMGLWIGGCVAVQPGASRCRSGGSSRSSTTVLRRPMAIHRHTRRAANRIDLANRVVAVIVAASDARR